MCKGRKTVTETLAWQVAIVCRIEQGSLVWEPTYGICWHQYPSNFLWLHHIIQVSLQTRGHHLWLWLGGSMFDRQNSFFSGKFGHPFKPSLSHRYWKGESRQHACETYILAAFRHFSMHWKGLVRRLLGSWVWDNLMPLGLFLFQPASFTAVSRIMTWFTPLRFLSLDLVKWTTIKCFSRHTWCFFVAFIYVACHFWPSR